jgi:hypothetical protein
MSTGEESESCVNAKDRTENGTVGGTLHKCSSKMHCAIRSGDLEQVQRLLDSGDKLCSGDGRNCFFVAACSLNSFGEKPWKFLERLLVLSDGRGAHARNQRKCEYKKCKKISSSSRVEFY